MLTFSPVPKITSGLDLAAPQAVLASQGNWAGVEERKLERGHAAVSGGTPCGNALQMMGSINAGLKLRERWRFR